MRTARERRVPPALEVDCSLCWRVSPVSEINNPIFQYSFFHAKLCRDVSIEFLTCIRLEFYWNMTEALLCTEASHDRLI